MCESGNESESGLHPVLLTSVGVKVKSNLEQVYLKGFEVVVCLLHSPEHSTLALFNWTPFLQLFYQLTLFLFDLKFRRDSRSVTAHPQLTHWMLFQIAQHPQGDYVCTQDNGLALLEESLSQ